MRRRRPGTAWLLVTLACACAPRNGDADDGARAQLAAMHAQVLEAHRQRDVDLWMSLEADDFVSANGGTVTFPSTSERRADRARYLQSTSFDVYRDVRPPIAEVSDDGTMGWVIAEVEVAGTQMAADSTPREVAVVWAWIELYRRIDGQWKLVGNVSNRRD